MYRLWCLHSSMPSRGNFEDEEEAIEAGELDSVKANYKYFNLSYGTNN